MAEQTEVKTPEPTPSTNSRIRITEELAEKVNANYVETGEFADLNAAAPAPSAETSNDASEPTAAAPDPKPEKKEEPALVAIKVDGVEMQVSKERVDEAGSVKALQMELAAKNRLDELNRALDQVKAGQRQEPAPKVEQPKPAEDLVKLFMDGPFNEDAARKFIETVSAKPAQSIDVKGEIRSYMSEQEVLTKFKSDFPDIVGDPFLLQLAVNEEEKARNGGDKRPPLDLWKDIGTKLMDWRGKTKPAQTDMTAKAERKQTITNIPSAGAKVPAPEPDKEPTPSEIVNEIRLARHQRIN